MHAGSRVHAIFLPPPLLYHRSTLNVQLCVLAYVQDCWGEIHSGAQAVSARADWHCQQAGLLVLGSARL